MNSKGTTIENHCKTVGYNFRINFMLLSEDSYFKGGEALHFQNKVEVTNKIAEECQEVFQALKIRRKYRYVLFKLGDEEIIGKFLFSGVFAEY